MLPSNSLTGLAYVGRIVQLAPMDADRLERAEVDCGPGGRWWGVVVKGDFQAGDLARVYLQDALLPETPEFEFLRSKHFRIRMQRLRGVPSEVLIMPAPSSLYAPGDDITAFEGVRKHEKPQPGWPGAARVRTFPAFIPRTDEPNFQRARHLVAAMCGAPVYITEKADGSSMTVYRQGDHVGVCSRNQEIEPDGQNVFWRVARELQLDERLPDGFAVQGELIGPGIQGNPMGRVRATMLAFQVYDLATRAYLDYEPFVRFCHDLQIQTVPVLAVANLFDAVDYANATFDDGLRALAEGAYPNGQPREGIVIRPVTEMRVDGERVSFKVLNLLYKG